MKTLMQTALTLVLLCVSCGFAVAETGGDVKTMVLDVCGSKTIENPTDEQIRTELAGLSMTNVDYFAILQSSSSTFVQILGDPSAGFILEYREGSAEAHYRATDDRISLARVVQAFIAYRDEKADWKAGLDFERMQF